MNHRVAGVEGGTQGVDRLRADIQSMFTEIREVSAANDILKS